MPNHKHDRSAIAICLAIFGIFYLLTLPGCKDADIAQWTSVGSAAQITCYSGGQVIYSGTSTGKVSTEHQSDGWYFEDAATHRLVRISGTCVIKN
jgi:hypothetical protein